jgi:GNAT superfamily N-acetyltransferase
MEVRPIKNDQELQEVYGLVYRQFRSEGYCDEQPDGKLRYYSELDGIPETTILVAIEDGKIVGTLSITEDGDFGKIHTDFEFPLETEHIRQFSFARGRNLCSAWRIATEPNYRGSRRAVFALINAYIEIATRKNLNCSLYTFNPKHVKIYERLLGFGAFSVGEAHIGNYADQAVLMYGDLETMIAHWKKIKHEK